MMDPDFADAVAERNFRMLHRYQTWSKKDQADEDGWNQHDNQLHERLIGCRYAECWLCHPELD